ncbi:hypothetical protein [Rhizobium leguminosarum]|uniref:Uncharacterized protein n=1 Tax=Rhizobium leguminosarum TaxID=384 RepID=A0A444I2L2_RHILE|nr:hypothetical protein [Rhizobium leguminosarum]ASS59346.1 hypothetical protein CHR56_32720 [Rhizobium leguminosarum bv. viciae]MBB4331828.1 hypothetical protein [Rhizobium leguminosarum]MBB4345522.1 hypothetical protein [Rhizobium leguminosarum]MBB4357453.1 hypothetical protein [Rhizobium leguminosarum]MBB4390234.1 hypothetical protein [Rhizobium leguminosarum]
MVTESLPKRRRNLALRPPIKKEFGRVFLCLVVVDLQHIYAGIVMNLLRTNGSSLFQKPQKQSEYFLRAAKAVETLKAKLPDGDRFKIATWLQKEVGFSASEAKSYVNFDAELSANGRLLQGKRVSPDAIRALIASDPKTRSECLVRIGRDDQVSGGKRASTPRRKVPR